MASIEIVNFGNSNRFRPGNCIAPRDEAELMEVLETHRSGKVRVMGSKHAWSPAIQTDGVLIDMRHFQKIEIFEADGQTFARIGAGCQMKTVLKVLNQQGLTTPSIGLITEQTIFGATAGGGACLPQTEVILRGS